MPDVSSLIGSVISPVGLTRAPGQSVTTSASLCDGVTAGSNRNLHFLTRRVTDATPALRAAIRIR